MFTNVSSMERGAPFLEPMVYSFIYICQSPQLRSCPRKLAENIRSLSLEPHKDGRPTHNGVWPGSPRQLFMTLLLLPQCHAAFSMILSTLVCVDRAPLASVCHSNSLQGVPTTPVTVSHVTQGTNPHNPEVWTRGWIYGRHSFPCRKC